MLQTRPYGSTGERVTVIGLGGAPLNQRSYADGVATIRRAQELGITYFDTSPGYGRGESQRIYGEGLSRGSPGRMLATKVGYLPEPSDHRSVEAIRGQVLDNLQRLRVDRVDTLQVHEAVWACWWADGVPTGEPIRDDVEYDFYDAPVLQVLRECREQGLCRYIGITGNHADQMARILEAVDVDTFLVAFNYDLLFRRARRRAIPLAVSKGTACILGGVFRYGALVREHPEWLSNPPAWVTREVRPRLRQLYALHRESQLSLVALTIRFLLADQAVSTILVGASTPQELEESVRAAEAGPLPGDLHARVEALGLSD